MNRPRSVFHSVRSLVILAVLLGAAAAATVGAQSDGAGRPGERRAAYAIGLWGDLPYSPEQATVGVPNLIADMNAQKLAFTAHDGDLKAGAGRCDDQIYLDSLAYFSALEAPVIFTPGDNDWTDCDRLAAGSFNSLERLDYERRLFFSTEYTLGQRRMRQEVQTQPLCLGLAGPAPCVENRRWDVGGVTYATLNVQGSCNNLCDTAPDPAEFAARNAANIVWLRETFAHASERGAAAVMLITQANPGWDPSDPTRAPLRNARTLAQTDGNPDGFVAFLGALRAEVIAFRRPVAYVHGDSHYFRVDKPFLDSAGRRLENFTRVETFGNNPANGTNDVQWVKVVVDVRSREVFSYEPQIVAGNRVAVPQP
jgi:hypothetical protein